MNRRRGVSLVEIMVVVTLATILLGLTLRLTGRSRANREADGTAAELKSALGLARSLSVNSGGAQLDLTAQSWTVRSGPSLRTEKSGQIPSSVEVNATSVVFNTNGSATAAASITVRSRTTNRQTVVNVNARTGAVASNLTVQ